MTLVMFQLIHDVENWSWELCPELKHSGTAEACFWFRDARPSLPSSPSTGMLSKSMRPIPKALFKCNLRPSYVSSSTKHAISDGKAMHARRSPTTFSNDYIITTSAFSFTKFHSISQHINYYSTSPNHGPKVSAVRQHIISHSVLFCANSSGSDPSYLMILGVRKAECRRSRSHRIRMAWKRFVRR